LPLVVTAGGAEREQMFRELSAAYLWPNGTPSPDRMSHPVTLVRWDDARAYCDWLSASTGRTVFLPTEAQWERAARGGVDGNRYPWGQQPDRAMANFLPAPAMKKRHGTTECGTYPPNPYGLFDMVGNVWEWVADWYAADYYTDSPRVDPQGPGHGYYRILRGGGWPTSDVRMLTCSHRHEVPPDTYSYAIGFRIACAV
jgi:formylglycine-generating enzyme required for sulfatase activity